MTRDGAGGQKTEGRRRLRNIVRGSSAEEVCHELRPLSRSHLSELMSGKHIPSLVLAIRIFRVLGIPVDAWDVDRGRKSQARP